MLEGVLHRLADVCSSYCALLTTTRVGLAYDICGAVVLTFSAAFLRRKRVDEAQRIWRAEAKTRDLYQGQFDSLVGVGLLLLGFCLQLVGTIQRAPKTIGLYFAIALVGIGLIFILMRPCFIRMRMKQLASEKET